MKTKEEWVKERENKRKRMRAEEEGGEWGEKGERKKKGRRRAKRGGE